jgi:hypothetical protein
MTLHFRSLNLFGSAVSRTRSLNLFGSVDWVSSRSCLTTRPAWVDTEAAIQRKSPWFSAGIRDRDPGADGTSVSPDDVPLFSQSFQIFACDQNRNGRKSVIRVWGLNDRGVEELTNLN